MQIIGQKSILETIENWEEVPRFIVIKGGRGAGKTTLMKKIADKLKCLTVEVDYKVDSVRNMIDTAYNVTEPVLYFIENAQDMSVAARNSLLKVTEEPPQQAYVVLMTNQDVIDTLRSRCTQLNLLPYTADEYKQYADSVSLDIPKTDDNWWAVCSACKCFDDLEYICRTGHINTCIDLADKILDHIHEVAFANAFKILKNLALKKDEDGIDPEWFLTFVAFKALNRLRTNDPESIIWNVAHIVYSESLDALELMRNKVLSKSNIVDMWALHLIQRWEAKC